MCRIWGKGSIYKSTEAINSTNSINSINKNVCFTLIDLIADRGNRGLLLGLNYLF
jgi:hypothetical protein